MSNSQTNARKRKPQDQPIKENKKNKSSDMSTDKMLKELLEASKRQDEVNKRLEAANKRQEDVFVDIRKRLDDQDDKIAKIDQKVDQKIDDIFLSVLSEVENRSRNKCNIVIYGLDQDPTDDLNSVTTFLKKIDKTVDVKRVIRFGNKPDVPKIAKVITGSEFEAAKIFQKYDKMSIDERKKQLGEKLFIERDLTKTQMAEKSVALQVKKELKSQGKTASIRYVNGHFKCVEIKQ